MSRAGRIILLCGAVAVAGCSGGLLPQPAPPPKLYRLTAPQQSPGPLPRVPAQLLVDDTSAPASLDTTRIALTRSPTSVDYFADAAWSDTAPSMVQARLVEALENSGRVVGVARQSASLHADFLLQPELRHFEAVYEGDAPPRIRIAINIRLVRADDRIILAQRVFEAAATPARNETAEIITAFDEADRTALQEIVAWAVTSIARASPERR
jgi:cholesterol transport system auxiliary component